MRKYSSLILLIPLLFGLAMAANPTIDSVAEFPDPVNLGSPLNFVVNWTEGDSEGTHTHICKTDALNSTQSSCSTAANTWCSANTTNPPLTNLAGYWPMNTGSGTTVFDNSSNLNNGTITSMTWVDGAQGKALQGGEVANQNFTRIPDNAAYDFGENDWSIMFWYKPDVASDRGDIIVKQSGTSAYFLMRHGNSGSASTGLYIQWFNGSVNIINQNTAFGMTTDWQLITLVVDNDEDEMRLYRNTALIDSSAESLGETADFDIINGVWEILESSLSTGGIPSSIDDLRVYSREVTTDEIQEVWEFGIYDEASPGQCSYTTQAGDGGEQTYYAFVCDELRGCSASTSSTFTVQTAGVTINSPSNNTFYTSNLTLNYTATSLANSTLDCTREIAGVNTTTNVANNSDTVVNFTEFNVTTTFVDVNCYDGVENSSLSVYFTVDDLNFTTYDLDPIFETSNQTYNVTVGFNPDIITALNLSLEWNNTALGNASEFSINDFTSNFTIVNQAPFVGTNYTANLSWTAHKLYFNASRFNETMSNETQGVNEAFFGTSTVNATLFEGQFINSLYVLSNLTDPTNLGTTFIFTFNSTNTTGNYSFPNGTADVQTPLFEANTTTLTWNNTFNFTLAGGAGGQKVITDSGTVVINRTFGGLCTDVQDGFHAMTWNLEDELNGSAVNNSLIDANLIFKLSGREVNFNLTDASSFNICVNPNGTHLVNSSINYAATAYSTRWHYLTNTTLNSSQVASTVTLALLQSGLSTVVDIDVKDSSGLDVPDILVIARREYLDEGIFKSVAACISDVNGDCAMALQLNSARYNFQLINITDSTLIKTSEPSILTTENTDPALELRIDIGQIFNFWNQSGNIQFNMTNTTVGEFINVTFNAIDNSGKDVTISLECSELSAIGNTLLHSSTVSASSASITCQLGNITSRRFSAVGTILFPDGTKSVLTQMFNGVTPFNFSSDGLIATVFILIALSFAFTVSPAASIMAMIIGLVVAGNLGFTLIDIDVIMMLATTLVFILWILRRNA